MELIDFRTDGYQYEIKVTMYYDSVGFSNTYHIKDELKSRGFYFDGLGKEWRKGCQSIEDVLAAIAEVSSLSDRKLYTFDEDLMDVYQR